MDDAQVRTDLLHRISERRGSIRAYLDSVRPKADRLTFISVVSSAIAAAATAGPALGGESFTEAVGRAFSLSADSLVWRSLCFVAVIVSVVAAVTTNLNKSLDRSSRLSTAEAVSTELEGLETLLEFGELPVQDAVKLYQSYVVKIPFVEESPPRPS